MAKRDLNLYFNEIKENGITNNIWFFTKQSFDNMMIIYYSYIVKSYEQQLKQERFAEFYYNKGLEYEYFKNVTHSRETYRNGVISESLGLVERDKGNYDTMKTTDAFKMIDKYLLVPENFEENNILFQRQVEKLVVNVNENLRRYNEVKDVSVFMVILLYKVLLELQRKYKTSILSFEEFVLFVIRVKKYSDWKQCIEYIEEYRKSDAMYNVELKDEIFKVTKEHIRFDNIINSLSCIYYEKNEYFKIVDIKYIENVLEMFEKSEYLECVDKNEMLEFLRSDKYFSGKLDDKIEGLSITLNEECEEYLYDNDVKSKMINIIKVPDNIKKYVTPDKVEYHAKKTDFLALNKKKYYNGILAEELVLNFEKERLKNEGREDLVEEIKWVSQELGDGLGYDIKSYQKIDNEYQEIFIEVKGTIEDVTHPFEITINEYNLAKEKLSKYKIYRITNMKSEIANCYIIDGLELDEMFELIPQVYKVYKK